MRLRSAWFGGLVGLFTSLPLLALYFFYARLATLPFVPFDVFDWLARVLPGGIITFGIDTIIALVRSLNVGPTAAAAKDVEQALALTMVIGTGVVMGLVIAWGVGRRPEWGWRFGLLAGTVLGLVVLAVEAARGAAADPFVDIFWYVAPWAAWGAVLGWLVTLEAQSAEDLAAAEGGLTRRGLFTQAIIGSLGLGFVLWGLGQLIGQPPAVRGSDQRLPGSAPPPPPLPQRRIQPAPGTRPELTSTDKFYRVDINLRPVQLDEQSWHLDLTGLFAKPGSLTVDQLMAYPAVTEVRTLSCISNPVGGDLISNAYFTGLRLRDLLADRGISPDAKELFLRSADGFYETVTLEGMRDPGTLLVYGMNGRTLPDEHGFPVRIHIPDRYGMKQPKWIVSMEAKGTQENRGYWPEREWSEEALVQITSVIDTYTTDQASATVPIGGIAWTGAQGVQKVEVQVDGRDWNEAQLVAPPLGPLTWVLWRFDWPRLPGTHNFRSRAIDGKGNIQIEQKHDTRPDGATGYDYKAGSY